MRSDGMMRWTATAVFSLFFLSSVSASLDRRERPVQSGAIPLKSLLSCSSGSAKNDEYRITEKTEVLLDGRPCRYGQIPNDAIIVLLETTTNESKEITRIHFRSARRPTSTSSK
jgi:hypothetical protein